MKRIFLLSTLVISSFGMMNLQTVSAAPQQTITPEVGANAKKLVANINKVISLQGDQFSKINDVCIDYFKQLDALTKSKPADLDAKTAALKQTRDSKIKALLTPAQLTNWSSVKL
jgi:hypothetical protein